MREERFSGAEERELRVESGELRVESEELKCRGTTCPCPSTEFTLLRGKYRLDKFKVLCAANYISTLHSVIDFTSSNP